MALTDEQLREAMTTFEPKLEKTLHELDGSGEGGEDDFQAAIGGVNLLEARALQELAQGVLSGAVVISRTTDFPPTGT